MAKSIFSTYSTAENRVTFTILSVFERLNSNTVTSILQVLMEDSTLELIVYDNQVKTRTKESVPDGRIKGTFDYIIETKIVQNGINRNQIKNHCESLKHKYSFSKLLVLTPDVACPKVLEELKEQYPEKIIWGSFAKLVEGIDTVLDEPHLLFDRESFLLLELKEFIIEEGLLPENYSEKVLIVPAGSAWGDYEKYSLYKCQPNRSFQKASYMGFYANGEIKTHFPKILGYVDSLNIQTDNLDEATVVIDRYGPGLDDIERTRIEQEVRDGLKNFKEQIGDQWNEDSKYIFVFYG